MSGRTLAYYERQRRKQARKDAKRLEKIERVEPVCIECGNMGQLVTGQDVYPHRPDLFSKQLYRCKCGAYVGCHPGTTIALGSPCGPVTRKARNAAHAAFDALWLAKAAVAEIGRGEARARAYAWLSGALELPPKDCHIGMMDAAMANRVVEVCQPILRKVRGHTP